MELIEKKDTQPICPHCQKSVNSIWFRHIPATFGRRYVYFCSHCSKILGVSHRKGFWMG